MSYIYVKRKLYIRLAKLGLNIGEFVNKAVEKELNKIEEKRGSN